MSDDVIVVAASTGTVADGITFQNILHYCQLHKISLGVNEGPGRIQLTFMGEGSGFEELKKLMKETHDKTP